jgi:hypothetical protein
LTKRRRTKAKEPKMNNNFLIIGSLYVGATGLATENDAGTAEAVPAMLLEQIDLISL